MRPSLDAELQHHAKALRGLARSLVGSSDADDLIQDAVLQTLQQRERPRALRGWLRQVLRHLAGKQHRDRALRQRREAAITPAAEVPPTDCVAEHRETLRRLDAALLALPEPYQGTLLLRYFEDLSPSAIAARTRVPLATVKSRLQRGLSLLRERLDGERDGWRAALAGAFGIERAMPVAASVAAGVILMGSGVKLVIGGAAAVLAVAATLLVVNGAPPMMPLQRSAAAAPVAAASADTANAARGPEPGGRTEVVIAGGGADAALATIRGRCVDEQGQPLANAAVKLGGSRTDQQSPSASGWHDQAASSGDDGRFAFDFAVPEHFVFRLDLHCADRCDGSGSWQDLKAGQSKDLGDVVLPRAMQFTGRVVDTQGNPVAGVMVDMPGDEPVARREVELRFPSLQPTGEDGTFASHRRSGRYWLRTTNRQLVAGTHVLVTLDPDLPKATFELVVYSNTDRPPICGVVVDEAGAPVEDAAVRIGTSSCRSGSGGAFRLHPGSDTIGTGPFMLQAFAAGREGAQSGPHALGEIVRIVLPKTRLPSVRVIVRTADGEPVTDFAADIALLGPGRVGPSHKTNNPRRHWDQGIAVLPEITPGDHAIRIDPGDEQDAPSSFVTVHVDGDTDVTITLRRRVERRLLVQSRNGAPVQASIELLDGCGQSLELQTIALPMPEWNTIEGPPRAELLQRGDTDAHGELLLRGPAGRDLALRLRGHAVALQIVQPIRLDGDGPLVITASAGAQWTGRLLPAEVAASLFAVSQPKPGERPGRRVVGIELSRGDMELHTFQERLFPYAEDGSFRIEGIPEGTWTATVFAMGHQYQAAEITVTDGQHLQQDLDIATLRPCRVALQIFVDGKPASDAGINAFGEHARGVGPRPMVTQSFLRTDRDGKVAFVTFAGKIGCELLLRRDGAGFGVMLPAIAVPSLDQFEQVLDLRLGGATVRVLRPDGEPAANQFFQLCDVTYGPSTFQTDTEGRAMLQHLPIGRHRLRSPVRSLGDEAAAKAFARQFGSQALQDAWIDVGNLDIGADNASLELQLPRAWDR